MPPIQPALLACSPHARSTAGIVAAKVADGIRLAIRPNDNNAVALVAGLMGRRSRKVPEAHGHTMPAVSAAPAARAQKCRSLTRTDGALLQKHVAQRNGVVMVLMPRRIDEGERALISQSAKLVQHLRAGRQFASIAVLEFFPAARIVTEPATK